MPVGKYTFQLGAKQYCEHIEANKSRSTEGPFISLVIVCQPYCKGAVAALTFAVVGSTVLQVEARRPMLAPRRLETATHPSQRSMGADVADASRVHD